MTKINLILLFSFVVTLAHGQSVLNGLYSGLEEICSTDSLGKKECFTNPEDPKWKWYHLTYIKVKGDSVFVDQDPIAIYKKDTIFSASDGAFYYYKGKCKSTDSTITINLTEIFCDYCGEEVEKQSDGTFKRIYRTKEYLGKVTKKGIIINNFLFCKTNKERILLSEHPPGSN